MSPAASLSSAAVLLTVLTGPCSLRASRCLLPPVPFRQLDCTSRVRLVGRAGSR